MNEVARVLGEFLNACCFPLFLPMIFNFFFFNFFFKKINSPLDD